MTLFQRQKFLRRHHRKPVSPVIRLVPGDKELLLLPRERLAYLGKGNEPVDGDNDKNTGG